MCIVIIIVVIIIIDVIVCFLFSMCVICVCVFCSVFVAYISFAFVVDMYSLNLVGVIVSVGVFMMNVSVYISVFVVFSVRNYVMCLGVSDCSVVVVVCVFWFVCCVSVCV